MKLPKEIVNGILIFAGIALYFLIMEFFGLSKVIYLRMLNAAFVYYGVSRTLQSNFKEGKTGYVANLLSAGTTAITGVLLSVAGLVTYIYARGGNEYVKNLSGEFLFGGNPTANEYAIGLLFEGIASGVIVVFIAMQLFRNKTAAQD
ncbi:hypothetical protein IVB69_09170 [Flavobacterium sp. J49]|uniref:hypothetical protein n=1 Tax=Flavobacterium sp. J49 TaxID=2718534 RepID=UPI0015940323|nr:hypothetical protein [Flavobacterium sp. J49]MBF6641651.1 hypothetical protein [Flavobacterium sp. J49]NIC02898.1 hypothetical protein [Flavobacterium sp. J49]